MNIINSQFKLEKDNLQNPIFWKNIGVRYDSLEELDVHRKKSFLKSFLNSLLLDELIELSLVLDIKIAEKEIKQNIINKIININSQYIFLLLLLNDFQKFKKQSITRYYRKIYNYSGKKPPLVKLLILFKDNEKNLLSILTYHHWLSRSSGKLFYFDGEINYKDALGIISDNNKEKLLRSSIIKETNKDDIDYRFFSYVIINESKFICLLYKQINDKTIADFDDAVRNKEIDIIMFSIDIENRKVEIKTDTAYEYNGIKNYIQNTSETILNPVNQKILNDYIGSKTLKTFISEKTASGNIIPDFLVNSITFRSSTLKNKPEITFETNNLDIWPSVADAHQKNTIDITSLKDVKSLSIKSMNISRKITGIIKKNGNILFKMNDARIDSRTLNIIKQRFKDKFGIPLFQEISNYQFKAGKADLIDYLLGYSNHLDTNSDFNKDTKLIYSNLIKENFLTKSTSQFIRCTDYNCAFTEILQNNESIIKKCPLCQEDIITRSVIQHEVNNANISKYIKKKLTDMCKTNDWYIKTDSKLTFGKDEVNLIKIKCKDNTLSLQFLTANQTINTKLVKQLQKMLDPTVLIFIGQQEQLISHYSNNCTQAITFGNFYVRESNDISDFIIKLNDELKIRTKNAISYAAHEGYKSMQKINVCPSELKKIEYSPDDLEDDGYTLLKDLFNNTVKWGKEKSGQAYPEGVFTVSYPRLGRDQESYAYSFDFKLTRSEAGIDLGISEQRKAAEYVNNLNDSGEIRYFSNTRELSGHIFISNQFKEKQKNSIQNYFTDNIANRCRTKAIFMTTDALMLLHYLYRKHYDEIEAKKIQFYEHLNNILMNNRNDIEVMDIENLFEEVLGSENEDFKTINMDRLSTQL